jgi:uncharacterized protein (DUF1800 family)
VRAGLFEFNPNRHDYGDKQFLGQTIRGSGLAEVDQAITLLARQPATARFVSRKLAAYLVADEPPAQLVQRMANTFLTTDGDIAQVLRTLFDSPEFAASLGKKFRDPVSYVLAATRLSYAQQPVLNTGPLLNWLNRLGEPLYGHQTPDGYALNQASWASPGQMTTRFEIARIIAAGNGNLFRADDNAAPVRAVVPPLQNSALVQAMMPGLGAGTRQALAQAGTPLEWNTFLLSAPEMMLY